MRCQIFNIYTHQADSDTNMLNRFLQSNRIISVDRQFVANGQNSFWSICVVVADGQLESNNSAKSSKRSSIDYREKLSPEVFSVYAKLRSLRNQLAEQQGTPPYAIFTNEQLAQMAQIEQPSQAALAEIEGIGEKRLRLYAEQFVAVLQGDHG